LARPIVLILHLFRLAGVVIFRKDYSPPSSPSSRPFTHPGELGLVPLVVAHKASQVPLQVRCLGSTTPSRTLGRAPCRCGRTVALHHHRRRSTLLLSTGPRTWVPRALLHMVPATPRQHCMPMGEHTEEQRPPTQPSSLLALPGTLSSVAPRARTRWPSPSTQ
jgi:hypothetical protein